MADTTIEYEAEYHRLNEENLIKDSMLLELSDALKEANFKVAMLNGQKKLRDQRIAQLEQQLNEKEPTA